jgi:hypothetical protein
MEKAALLLFCGSCLTAKGSEYGIEVCCEEEDGSDVMIPLMDGRGSGAALDVELPEAKDDVSEPAQATPECAGSEYGAAAWCSDG